MKEDQGREHLGIYLKDHYAGGVGALELVAHLIKEHDTDPIRPFFCRLQEEIQADHDQLLSLMTRLGHEESSMRNAGAWMAEKVGRIKIGFAASGDSKLRLLESLEALLLGITGKKMLWRALARLRPGWPILEGMDLAQLEARAKDQADRVDARRLEVACEAFRSA